MICPNQTVPIDLMKQLESVFPRRNSYQFVPPAGMDGPEHFQAEYLARELGLSGGNDFFSAADLSRHEHLERTCITVDVRGLTAEEQRRWTTFASSFSLGCGNLPQLKRPRIWVVASFGSKDATQIPGRDVHLAVEWWWGAVGNLDVRIFLENEEVKSDLIAPLAEIIRWDLSLVDVVRAWDGSLEGLQRLEIPAKPEARRSAIGAIPAGPRPSPSCLDGWCRGEIESWASYLSDHISVELSTRPAALASRAWLAQVGSITPLIEIERTRLAEELATRLESSYIRPEWRSEDISSLEIGPLYLCYDLHRTRSDTEVRMQLLEALRDARNDLAHRRPLSLAFIRNLRTLARRDQEERVSLAIR